MATYSTKQAAKRAGVHWITLHRWIKGGKVRPPRAIRMNGGKLWRWTTADVEKVRRYKAAHYWQGRGRRKKKA